MNLIASNNGPSGSVVAPPREKRTWTVGTLTYTTAGLIAIFCWMLWGDFAWSMRDRSILPMMQLMFKKYNASDITVSLLFSSIPITIGLLTGPIISYLSDNHRGRWGRRIPFLLFTTPFIVVSIIGLAFASKIGAYAHQILAPKLGLDLSILIFLGLFLVIFEFTCGIANMIFGGLVNDVVPQAVVGRFFSLFRAVSLVAGIIFNYWFFGKTETHFVWIFLGVALLYGVGFTILCLRVKEGEYPPLPVQTEPKRAKRFVAAAKTYFKVGYGNSYYLWFFAATILAGLAVVPWNLYGLFYAKSLHMSNDAYGKYLSYSFVISLCLAYPLGALADRFHPLRLLIVTLALYMLAMLWNVLYLFDVQTFGYSVMAQSVLAGAFYTVSASLGQRLLPRENFVQIGSAGGTINCLIGIVFAPALGIFLDSTGHNYRSIFHIGFVVTALALVVNLILYKKFMALGGPQHYVAPE
jgi:MFS family permease